MHTVGDMSEDPGVGLFMVLTGQFRYDHKPRPSNGYCFITFFKNTTKNESHICWKIHVVCNPCVCKVILNVHFILRVFYEGFHDGTGKLSPISIVRPNFFVCLLDLSSAFKLFDASMSYRSPTMFTQVYGYTDNSFF